MSWFGDVVSDVGGAVSSVASPLLSAAGAPITSAFKSTGELLQGRPLASFKTTLAGMGTTLKPVATYTEAVGEGFVNFGRGAYNFSAGVATGDSGRAIGGIAGGLTSGTNVAAGDATIAKLGGEDPASKSLTGYSGLAYGNYSSQNYNRSIATTAIIAGGAAASAFGSTATGSAAYTGVIDGAIAGGLSLLKKAGDTVVNTAEDAGLGALMGAILPGQAGGTSSAAPYSTPGSLGASLSSNGKIAIGAAALIAAVLIIRKVRK